MLASQLAVDVESGAVIEVPEARSSYYSEERGLTVQQQFFIYPDDRIYQLSSVDGTGSVIELRSESDEEATFRHLYPAYFAACPTTEQPGE